MKNIILFFLFSLVWASSVFAWTIPSDAQYSDDGTHWYVVSGSSIDSSYQTLIIDGVEKTKHSSFYTHVYLGNTLYSTASDYPPGSYDTITRQYILRDWIVIDSWSSLWIVQDSANKDNPVWWYVYDEGTFRVKDISGKIILEDANSSSYSSTQFVASGVFLTTVSSKNEKFSTSYINATKVWNQSLSYIGKQGQNLFFSDYGNGHYSLYQYNIRNKKLKKLPGSDTGIYAIVLDKNGDIWRLEYVILVWEQYALADRDGKIISKERYDSIDLITAYWSNFFRSMKIGEKKYFSFADKVYWPYDQIDTFNPSFGYNPSDTSSVRRWSIFVQKNGKNYIVVNGKEVLIGN